MTVAFCLLAMFLLGFIAGDTWGDDLYAWYLRKTEDDRG